jgi:hypothetical protein
MIFPSENILIWSGETSICYALHRYYSRRWQHLIVRVLFHHGWYVIESKASNNHHLGPEFRPECQQKHVRVCMHGKVLVAWLGSWPWWRGHINNNCRKILHDDLACPNMASVDVITYMNNKLLLVTWSNQNNRAILVHRGQIKISTCYIVVVTIRSRRLYVRVPNHVLPTTHGTSLPRAN